MDKTKKETAEEKVEAQAAPVYSREELIGAADKVFSCSPDIVTAALRVAGIQRATIAEATTIVRDFAGKEIK